MAEESVTPDALVAAIAARQHGAVSIDQLRRCGLSDDAVLGRRRSGRLHRIHRGVYAVGHRGLGFEGLLMAAALAFPGQALISHRSAAGLWRLLPPHRGPVEVSVLTPGGRAERRGLRVHRRASLSPRAGTRRLGIPVTTPERTIADLRASASATEVRRAIRQAEVLGLQTGIERSEPTRSELEELFLELCRRHRLALPEVNVRVGRVTVDFLWRGPRLVVETDGYRYHRGLQAFEEDHSRDLELRALGYEILRLTYRQVTDQEQRVVGALREALGGAAP